MDICRWLSDRGIPVKVLTYQPITTPGIRAPAHEKENRLEIFRINWPGNDLFHRLQKIPLLQTVYTSTGLFFRTIGYLRSHRREIEVIHAAGFNSALIAKITGRFYGLEWVMSTHAIYGFRRNTIMGHAVRWILNGAKSIIAISADSKRELAGIGISENRIVVHTTWVDQEKFKPRDKAKSRRKLDLDDRFTVLFVGRLRENKGVRLLLEAARLLPDIRFLLVGEGPLQNVVQQASSGRSNIRYDGPVDNSRLSVYYNAVDVAVMPSLYPEPFGRVILEAMSCGTATICSNLGAITGFLNEQVSCLIDPSIDNLREAIVNLRDNPELVREMSASARQHAKIHFSHRNMETILSAYGIFPRDGKFNEHSS